MSGSCIHCHLCQNSCSMLSKYGIDIGDSDRLRELAYHCFLCGECTRVCPEGIDGRAEILRFREEYASGDGINEIKATFKGTLAEKSNYKFRNYRRATSGAVYFPGCNFPSLYPKTSAYISEILKKEYGIGTVYDCCGKPIAELGLKDNEADILESMNKRLAANGITELITACPNCKGYLENRLDIPVVDIFTKLKELGIGNKVEGDRLFYIPCPDREYRSWLKAIGSFVDGEIEAVQGVMCCGLGGMARAREAELADSLTGDLSKAADGRIVYTYCASCVGSFTRGGQPAYHILPEIMGTHEKPAVNLSYLHRMKTRWL